MQTKKKTSLYTKKKNKMSHADEKQPVCRRAKTRTMHTKKKHPNKRTTTTLIRTTKKNAYTYEKKNVPADEKTPIMHTKTKTKTRSCTDETKKRSLHTKKQVACR